MKTITKNSLKDSVINVLTYILITLALCLLSNNSSAKAIYFEDNVYENVYYSSAEITSIRQCHNVKEGGKLGMVILVSFNINNARGSKGELAAWFYDDYGKILYDFNGLYYSSDGQVCTHTTFYPRYTNTVYTDVRLFIPYSELHVRSGYVPLNFRVGVIADYSNLKTSDFCSFNVY